MPTKITAVTPIITGLFGLVDKLFTTEADRMAARLKLLELEKSGELAQIAVNTQEAKHSSVFVAGWRPFIGWVCGLSFTWVYLLRPMMDWVWAASGQPPLDLPVINMADMMAVLMGMLGLGALRTWEKATGVSREDDPMVTGKVTSTVTNLGSGGSPVVDRRATGQAYQPDR